MQSFQAPSQKYGVLAAIAVFLVGSISQIFRDGLNIITQSFFWYGLYGWLAVAIVVGYLVYLGLSISGLLKLNSSNVSVSHEEMNVTDTETISPGGLPAWKLGNLPKPPPLWWFSTMAHSSFNYSASNN